MELVCVIILNYNNGSKTIACLDSLFIQTYKNYIIAIVDNCSTDDSIEIIVTHLEQRKKVFDTIRQHSTLSRGMPLGNQVTLIHSNSNGGYAFGNNIGIDYAKKNKSVSHILILNNDVELPKDFLEKAYKSYNKLVKYEGKSRVALTFPEYTLDNSKIHNGFYYLNLLTGLALSFPHPLSIKYIVGACIFLPVNAPFMDDSFFLYFDDVDYSILLKKQGFRLNSSELTNYYHEMGSSSKLLPDRHKIIFKSMKKFYKNNYPYLFPFVVFLRFFMNIFMGRIRIAIDLLKISIPMV